MNGKRGATVNKRKMNQEVLIMLLSERNKRYKQDKV